MRVLSLILSAVCCAPLVAQQEPAAEQDARIVFVSAEGYDRDDALRQALRKALEQGAGAQIAGFSQVENFALARDTIYSRAAGIVSEYTILGEQEGAGGTWEVKIRASVRPSAVAETWGEVQNVLDQIGRPRIMVWIDEQIDGQLQPQSLVESRIEELFVKAGFDLVAREAVADVRRREGAGGTRESDAAGLARLAKDAGAHILIRGHAHADRAGIEDLYGVAAAFYNCDVQAKAYSTDTGKLLASESIPVTRRGARSRREFSPQAARAALVDAAFPRTQTQREPVLAVRLFESVMEQWSTQITAGGDIELRVEGLDFKMFLQLKKTLAGLNRIQSVDADFTDNTGLYRIKAGIQAQTLAERLTEKPFDDWLSVTDLKPNRIHAKATASP